MYKMSCLHYLSGTIPYIIQPGDTFYKLSQHFNTTLSQIMLLNPTINPYFLQIGQVIYMPKLYNLYSNSIFNVTFLYPAHWYKVTPTRYEGIDGFFEISANPSRDSMEDLCKIESFDSIKSYGSDPLIKKFKVGDQGACFIIPSNDQAREMRNQAALLVKYSRPIKVNGQNFIYFVLWTNKHQIKKIANTLKFFSLL